jgi:hypothetical protein
MSIEACGEYRDDVSGISGIGSDEVRWNDRAISRKGESVAHLFNSCPMQEGRWNREREIKPMGGGNVEGEFVYTWGGEKNENKFSGGIRGKIYDDRGNYAEAELSVKENKRREVRVKGGHEEKKH